MGNQYGDDDEREHGNPGLGDHADEHHVAHGRFSTGQEVEGETAEKEHRGDFAEGQQAGPGTVHDERRGDFAEGQEQAPHEHADDLRGDFARGQHDHGR